MLARSNNGAGWIDPLFNGVTSIFLYIRKISLPHLLGKQIKIHHLTHSPFKQNKRNAVSSVITHVMTAPSGCRLFAVV